MAESLYGPWQTIGDRRFRTGPCRACGVDYDVCMAAEDHPCCATCRDNDTHAHFAEAQCAHWGTPLDGRCVNPIKPGSNICALPHKYDPTWTEVAHLPRDRYLAIEGPDGWTVYTHVDPSYS